MFFFTRGLKRESCLFCLFDDLCLQVVQLCEVLKMAPHVRILHLPHLACGLDGLKAVASLVENNPLVSLNLAGSLSSGTPVSFIYGGNLLISAYLICSHPFVAAVFSQSLKKDK